MSHQQRRQQEQAWEQQQIIQWRQAAQAEFQRHYALPLPDLAAEVMQKAFGPGDPGYDDDNITVAHQSSHRGPTVREISELFVPDGGAALDVETPLPPPPRRKVRPDIRGRIPAKG